MSKRSPYNEVAVIRGALRRAFSRSPAVQETLRKVRREVPWIKKGGERAKRDHVEYQCYTCKKWVGSVHISVDHVDPVIPPGGFTDWNTFVARLFCGSSNLAACCESCHIEKSNRERQARQLIKDKKIYLALLNRGFIQLDTKEQKLLKRLTKKLGKEYKIASEKVSKKVE